MDENIWNNKNNNIEPIRDDGRMIRMMMILHFNVRPEQIEIRSDPDWINRDKPPPVPKW